LHEKKRLKLNDRKTSEKNRDNAFPKEVHSGYVSYANTAANGMGS